MTRSLKTCLAGSSQRSVRGSGSYPVPEVSLHAILSTLYKTTVHPILEALGFFTESKDPEFKLPKRIWWCPTGPLTFLPIHAARANVGDKLLRTSDYVISFYTPTISSLLLARDRQKSQLGKTLTVASAESTGSNWHPLPCAAKEAADIQALGERDRRRKFVELRDGKALKSEVLRNISGCDWVHFACHSATTSCSLSII